MGDIGAIIQPAAVPAVAACASCHAPLSGPFCAACGQPRDTGYRSVLHLLKGLVEDIASFDSRILRTARAMMLQPGELTRAFHEGRTQPYVPPVRLYLFVSLLFFLILSVTGLSPMQFSTEQGESGPEPTIIFFSRLQPPPAGTAPLKGLSQELQSEGVDVGAGSVVGQGMNDITKRLFANPATLNATMTEWIPRILFLLLPLFALLLQLVYWGQRKTFFFVDHLVFSLNFHSFGFVLLLAGGAARAISARHSGPCDRRAGAAHVPGDAPRLSPGLAGDRREIRCRGRDLCCFFPDAGLHRHYSAGNVRGPRPPKRLTRYCHG